MNIFFLIETMICNNIGLKQMQHQSMAKQYWKAVIKAINTVLNVHIVTQPMFQEQDLSTEQYQQVCLVLQAVKSAKLINATTAAVHGNLFFSVSSTQARRNPCIVLFLSVNYTATIRSRRAASLFWFIPVTGGFSFPASTVSYKPSDSKPVTGCEHLHI